MTPIQEHTLDVETAAARVIAQPTAGWTFTRDGIACVHHCAADATTCARPPRAFAALMGGAS